MFETLNDAVDVLVVFTEGRIRPLRFRWKGRVIRIGRVTGEWTRREGANRLSHFSVEAQGTETFELCYDPRGLSWKICKAWSTP
jgi:hypothetical protein